ncbi:MAG: hypothetical protein AAF211_00640 [Myxococcota bacterium]
MWWVVLASAHAAAWVLPANRPVDAQRALRAAKRAGIVRAVPYDAKTWCVEVEDPRLRFRNRVARKLRGPVESRTDCDWAWFPEGTGWTAVLVERPADTLLPALKGLGWPYYDLNAASEGPLRVCTADVVAGPLDALADDLSAAGVAVLGVRRVGACRRER